MRLLKAAFMALVLVSVSAAISAEDGARLKDDPRDQQGNALIRGEVKYVSEKAKKITIKHEEIKSLNMQPMTMVFRVKENIALNQYKVGDTINFIAQKIDDHVVIVQIERR